VASAGSAAPSAGSGSAAGSAAPAPGSAAPAAGSGSAADSDAPFDDTLTLPKQPARGPQQQAVVDKAITALRTGLTATKTTKDSAALCKAIPPLSKAITASLFDVRAPAGVDATAYANARDEIVHTFSSFESGCQYPENLNLEDLQHWMTSLRTQFVTFIGLGA
jgi:hypothetical protein